MLSPKLRRKLLMKWAQAVPGAPASPASPASPPSPTSPASPSSPTATTIPTSTTAPAVQAPPPFNPASGPWAWITRAYNPATVRYLSILLNMISTVMHYATNGAHNLVKDQNGMASLDPSGAFSVDGKNAMMLALLFFKTFLNRGNVFTPTAKQIHDWADSISNSQPLLNLSQLNPTGPASQQLNLGDSLRQTILNNLSYLKQYNPIQ